MVGITRSKVIIDSFHVGFNGLTPPPTQKKKENNFPTRFQASFIPVPKPVAFPLTLWRFEVHHYQGRVLRPVAHERQLHSHELVKWTTRNPRFQTSGLCWIYNTNFTCHPHPHPQKTLQQKKAKTTKTNPTNYLWFIWKVRVITCNHPKNHWTIDGQKNLFFFACRVQRNLRYHQWLEISWDPMILRTSVFRWGQGTFEVSLSGLCRTLAIWVWELLAKPFPRRHSRDKPAAWMRDKKTRWTSKGPGF